jgi:hypothetical protein
MFPISLNSNICEKQKEKIEYFDDDEEEDKEGEKEEEEEEEEDDEDEQGEEEEDDDDEDEQGEEEQDEQVRDMYKFRLAYRVLIKEIKSDLNGTKKSKILKTNGDQISTSERYITDKKISSKKILDSSIELNNNNNKETIEIKSSSNLNKKVKILPNYVITEERVIEILGHINDVLNLRSKDNGRKFRNSHSFKDFIPREMHFTNVKVSKCVSTVPCCIVCQNYINKDEDRIKYSNFHYPDNTQCDTHVYHVDCFLVIDSARKQNGRPICIATCANAGCKKGKSKVVVLNNK